MKLKNIIREATAALKRNWVRSILTILGISVGVGAFICVVAIGNAGSKFWATLLQSWGKSRWSRVCLQTPTDILKLSMLEKTGSLCSEGSLPSSCRFDDGT